MTTRINKHTDKIPEPTLRRLPWYLSNAKLMKERGEKYVSSTQISRQINIDASQIAKDLSFVNISGRTRVGYEIDSLIRVLEDFLGFTNLHEAYLFGVGSLGGALLRDSGLEHFGLKIIGAFDVKPELVGTTINGVPVFHSNEFESLMKENRVNIGVLTVPINIARGDYRQNDCGRYQSGMELYSFPYSRPGVHRGTEYVTLRSSCRDV